MDNLRDSVSLRSYGQRDPLQEYKKEAFRLFEAMMGRIYSETTQAMLHMEAPQVSTKIPEADEPDEDTLSFKHPAAPARELPASAAPQGKPQSPASEDGMIYHGSRADQEAPQKRAPTAQAPMRSAAKVGRNDLCPCGSTKKFKKCHGQLETNS